jgi:hypothetical protein
VKVLSVIFSVFSMFLFVFCVMSVSSATEPNKVVFWVVLSAVNFFNCVMSGKALASAFLE